MKIEALSFCNVWGTLSPIKFEQIAFLFRIYGPITSLNFLTLKCFIFQKSIKNVFLISFLKLFMGKMFF